MLDSESIKITACLRKNKTYLIVGGIILLFLVIASFSMTSNNYRASQSCPKTTGASTDENIQLMKRNLWSIAEQSPSQDIEGQVIFTDGVSVDDFIRFVDTYQIHIKETPGVLGGSSIQVQRTSNDGRGSVQGLKMTTDFFQKDSFLKEVATNSSSLENEDPKSPMEETLTVINFTANTTANEFQKFWNEHQDTVRAIGVGCTRVFYIVGPSDPIQFGGPSFFDR